MCHGPRQRPQKGGMSVFPLPLSPCALIPSRWRACVGVSVWSFRIGDTIKLSCEPSKTEFSWGEKDFQGQ